MNISGPRCLLFIILYSIMPHLIPNIFQKAYTPYTAKLAPKNLWSRPSLGKCLITIIRLLTLGVALVH